LERCIAHVVFSFPYVIADFGLSYSVDRPVPQYKFNK